MTFLHRVGLRCVSLLVCCYSLNIDGQIIKHLPSLCVTKPQTGAVCIDSFGSHVCSRFLFFGFFADAQFALYTRARGRNSCTNEHSGHISTNTMSLHIYVHCLFIYL